MGPVEVFARAALAPILEAATARTTSPFVGWAPRGLYLEPEITVEVRYLASDASGLRHATLVG